MKTITDKINDWVEEHGYDAEPILLADGFEEAFIGIGYQFNRPMAVYDTDKCFEILMRDGMTEESAREYFEFNVLGSYVGDYTPMFLNRFKE
jgi:hypothetical protein